MHKYVCVYIYVYFFHHDRKAFESSELFIRSPSIQYAEEILRFLFANIVLLSYPNLQME